MPDDARTRADIEPILKEIVEVLVREYKPELIILYGSYAYGNPTRHSDIDLFIVKETEKGSIDRYVEAARTIFNPNRPMPIQPLVLTPTELAERLRIGDPFFQEIVKKGRRLYGRIKRTVVSSN